MNILIVDDVPVNRKLLRATLEAEGYSTFEAAEGAEALQVLERESVQAVITDILMPNMDGFRFCQEVRKLDQFRSLPIIVYTSTYTSPADAQLAESVGADKYLTKPAPTATLLQTLDDALRRQTAHPAPAPDEETQVLRQYNKALVDKLEEKNTDLRQALDTLSRAHDRIVELNAGLERRVAERTAQLEAKNQELTSALAQVKELRGLLPICSYCKKIRNDQDYWQNLESYLGTRTNAQFSHGICPDCFDSVIKPELERLDIKLPSTQSGGGQP